MKLLFVSVIDKIIFDTHACEQWHLFVIKQSYERDSLLMIWENAITYF